MTKNSLTRHAVQHLLLGVQVRFERVRRQDTSIGASAIELAIITAVLAAIAIAIGGIVYNKIKETADKIDTNVPTFST